VQARTCAAPTPRPQRLWGQSSAILGRTFNMCFPSASCSAAHQALSVTNDLSSCWAWCAIQAATCPDDVWTCTSVHDSNRSATEMRSSWSRSKSGKASSADAMPLCSSTAASCCERSNMANGSPSMMALAQHSQTAGRLSQSFSLTTAMRRMAVTLDRSVQNYHTAFLQPLLRGMAQRQPPLYSPGRELEVKRATTPRYLLLLHLSQPRVRPIHLHARKRVLRRA
jgi:hypothetical protein